MNLVVDGSTSPDPRSSVYDSDPAVGMHPPFIVFDIDLQEFVSQPFPKRELAEQWKDQLQAFANAPTSRMANQLLELQRQVADLRLQADSLPRRLEQMVGERLERTAVLAWSAGMDAHTKARGLLVDARELGAQIAQQIRGLAAQQRQWTAGDECWFRRPDGAIVTDTVRGVSTTRVSREPYAPGYDQEIAILTDHSWMPVKALRRTREEAEGSDSRPYAQPVRLMFRGLASTPDYVLEAPDGTEIARFPETTTRTADQVGATARRMEMAWNAFLYLRMPAEMEAEHVTDRNDQQAADRPRPT